MPRLTPVVEIKHTLAGLEKRFDCMRLAGDDRHAAVLWIAREPMHVHGVDLPAGTISFGHFWTDRFYNVYHWVDAVQQTVGLYFNIADQTRIAADRLEWRDLVVDVLATPADRVDGAGLRPAESSREVQGTLSGFPSYRLDVLDEDELPATLEPDVAAHLAAGKQAILERPAAVIREVEAASRALYPLVFPA